MSVGEGQATQVDEITNNGDTAINITEPNAAQLAGIDTLYVVNPSNSNFGAEYLANQTAIADAVNDGMNLIIFDRYVTNAQTILPGGTAITAVRDFSSGADVNVAAGAPSQFTNGSGGTIDDSTFDGGNWSSHGYVELSSLPAGATPLLTTSDPTHIVAFTYPYGDGNVFYSTMPIDYYTGSSNANITQSEINTLFGNTQEIMCFARGTIIETQSGAKLIQDLQIGDHIPVMSGGAAKIRWICSSKIAARQLAENTKLRPVRISAGALGIGLPRRDLWVSRQHRILVNSKIADRMFNGAALIAAIHLTRLPGIWIDETVEEIEYFHILFDQHQVIWAEGALSESLLNGPQALSSISHSHRAELEAVFPEFRDASRYWQAAAEIPEGRKQKKFVARHLQNGKKPVLAHLY